VILPVPLSVPVMKSVCFIRQHQAETRENHKTLKSMIEINRWPLGLISERLRFKFGG
jgi:hypothetical protein